MVLFGNRPSVQLLMLAASLTYLTMHTTKADTAPSETTCPPDMQYGCQRTCFGDCDGLNSTSEACILLCKYGCECKDLSLVRTTKDSNICVPPSRCKVTCPANMHFQPCVTKSDPTCNSEEPVEHFKCRPRCVCNAGYVNGGNTINRTCIKKSDCPPSNNSKK